MLRLTIAVELFDRVTTLRAISIFVGDGCWNFRFGRSPTVQNAVAERQASKVAVCYVRNTGGFRTAPLCRRAGRGGGRGAGVRKPRKEETPGRKRRGLAGRNLWGFCGRGRSAYVAAGGRRRPVLSVGAKTASFFDREDTRAWRECSGWREFAEVVRTSRCCSGARLEARRNGAGVDPDPGRRWRARGARAVEGFDDDHPATATRTAAPRRRSFGVTVLEVRVCLSGRAFRRGERLADALDVARSNRAGKQAVMADAVEATRQHVQEKAAGELGGVERHGLEPVAAFDPVVLPFEGDARLVERDEAGVRDGDAVGVAGEISEHGPRSGEGSLGVDHPCDRESSGEENEHEVLKPFGAIQRVQLPPGKGQPTSRKRALHGVRRRPS